MLSPFTSLLQENAGVWRQPSFSWRSAPPPLSLLRLEPRSHCSSTCSCGRAVGKRGATLAEMARAADCWHISPPSFHTVRLPLLLLHLISGQSEDAKLTLASAGDLWNRDQPGPLVLSPPGHSSPSDSSTVPRGVRGFALRELARHLPLLSSALPHSPAGHLGPQAATVFPQEVHVGS